MKKGQKLWTEDELILTMNLYCKLPFGKLHQGSLGELILKTGSAHKTGLTSILCTIRLLKMV